ncbi:MULTISPECIES: chitooligosaccharide deacetylase NodB [Mesorhizobium]|uniref:Chitooligosaccharide deacetylase n=1 Tax=Mesorhizobium qingshengii TaxID=1165689 RepID=A0A1G5ZZQ8_9HYPH|nr:MULTISPECIES: chitooligosaccharide deacetylase NodB [Mesorhizobium]MCH4561226.1 chitooligosaccharide deacetylase NodB [Mesorhizobium jarvisii]QGU21228.1 chitooligosaccharide deacetylase NodB [Mesorhizobium huakuii 7653R]SDA99763.1 beta-1,4-N-acetylglucosamine oligosaccharide deacetylase NodB [Mesorhizobium qingshengii]
MRSDVRWTLCRGNESQHAQHVELSGFKQDICTRVVTEERSVYLTFDDGPNPIWTPEVLDLLAQHRVPATFFVIGAEAVDQPELIRRMIADGHEVANHTMTHPDLFECELGEVECEIAGASRAIRLACPEATVRHFRAPYGSWTEEVLATSASAGLAALHWSVDPRDWSRPGADSIVDAVLAGLRPGAIVLLHDGCERNHTEPRDQTITALSHLIPSLHDRGFVVRSLPQHH